jgi:putative phosphoribosyl transferase
VADVPFLNRSEAGQALAARLDQYKNQNDLLVLGLPRGGVVVAFEVAQALGAELDVFLVRKLGMPGHEELAIGALASGGIRVLNRAILDEVHLSSAMLEAVTAKARRELEERERLYRKDRPAPVVKDRTVILVDDGLATGATMLAAARAIKPQNPRKLIAAVPVAPESAGNELRKEADDIVCAIKAKKLDAVGNWYEDFSQTTDDEVKDLLERAAHRVSRCTPE